MWTDYSKYSCWEGKYYCLYTRHSSIATIILPIKLRITENQVCQKSEKYTKLSNCVDDTDYYEYCEIIKIMKNQKYTLS